eukprot:m.363069 g.363069  ORF g.363069 m.363069 type:complete len:499 (+) comp21420_c0_seq1:163-1659(+)
MASTETTSSSQERKQKRRPAGIHECNKCFAPSRFVLRQKDGYCTDCLVESFTRKARQDIGKHRVIHQGETVAVAYSGGNRSSALVKFVRNIMESDRRPFRVTPIVFHVDETKACPGPYDQENACVRSSFVESCGFELVTLRLEHIFLRDATLSVQKQHPAFDPSLPKSSPGYSQECSQLVEDECVRMLQALFDKVSINSKTLLRVALRHVLLERTLRERNITKVLFGDCASRLAMHVLNTIVQGNGVELPHVTAYQEERASGVSFLRPFRLLSARMVAFYNVSFRIPTACPSYFETGLHNGITFEGLLQEFVANQEAEFPSAVAAVMRTAQKIEPNPDSLDTDTRCVMCQNFVEKRDTQCLESHHHSVCTDDSTEHVPTATTTTSAGPTDAGVSAPCTSVTSAVTSAEGCCSAGETAGCTGGGCNTGARTQEDDAVWPALINVSTLCCYSCRGLLNDISTPLTVLPPHVRQNSTFETRRNLLRQQVQEFLLDDAEEED